MFEMFKHKFCFHVSMKNKEGDLSQKQFAKTPLPWSRHLPVALFWKVAGNLILTSKIGYFWSHGARIVAYTIIVKISVRGMGLGM